MKLKRAFKPESQNPLLQTINIDSAQLNFLQFFQGYDLNLAGEQP